MPIRHQGTGEPHRHYIREWRHFHQLTLNELADRIGISAASLSRLELGRQSYTQPILESLASALSCRPSDLIEIDPSKADTFDRAVSILRGLEPDQLEMAFRILESLRPEE